MRGGKVPNHKSDQIWGMIIIRKENETETRNETTSQQLTTNSSNHDVSIHHAQNTYAQPFSAYRDGPTSGDNHGVLYLA